MAISIHIELNDALYLRDPQQTKLGRSIIENSILLIDELGIEGFTFRKLAKAIQSTEASIYRYFINKHKLLIYLVSWYWEWIKYQIEYHCMNIDSAERRLAIIIDVLVESTRTRSGISFINEEALHRIAVAESSKAYHTKSVDAENQAGFFWNYKSLCALIAKNLSSINPNYPYPRSLASTLVDMAQQHLFFAEHLPSLTDIHWGEQANAELKQMLLFKTHRLLGI